MDCPVWNRATRVGAQGAGLVLAACLTLFAVLTPTHPDSFNELSRLATIESLVERGTWSISDSGLTSKTADKAFYGGEFYSDKTPIFSAMTAGLYLILHNLLGAEIDAGDCTQRDPICSYWWFSVLMVALPASVGLALFYYVGRQLSVVPLRALLVTAALGFGTMMLPYSTVYNSHVPASVYAYLSFVGLMVPGLSSGTRRVLMTASGLLAGLTVATDLPSVFLAAAIGIIAVLKHRWCAIWFVGGATIPLLLTAAFNVQIHQSVLPVYMRGGVYAWENSPWVDGLAGRSLPEMAEWGQRVFNTLVGDHGILVAWPTVLLPMVGMIRQIAYRPSPYRLEASAFLAAIVAQLAAFLFLTAGFGGRSYGIRYLLSPLPILFFFSFCVSFVGISWRKGVLCWMLFSIALVVSCASTIEGAVKPWRNWHPVFYVRIAETGVGLRVESPFSWRPAQRVDAEFGSGVSLVGYDLSSEVGRPGDTLSLVLFWNVQSVSPGSKVFVHLRDNVNHTVLQADHSSSVYRRPTSFLERVVAGDSVVRGEIRLDLPPEIESGTYRLLVGVYDPTTRQRLPLRGDQSGENAIAIGSLRVN